MRKRLVLSLSLSVSLALLAAACGRSHDSQEGPLEAPADAPKGAAQGQPQNLPPGADPEAPPSSAPPPPPAEAGPAVADASSDLFSGDFNLAGTEPFWSAEIRAGRITLKRPDNPDVAMPNPGPVITGKSAIWNGGAEGRLMVVVEKKPCNNGMSDKKYAYTASVKLGETVMSGCATRP